MQISQFYVSITMLVVFAVSVCMLCMCVAVSEWLPSKPAAAADNCSADNVPVHHITTAMIMHN